MSNDTTPTNAPCGRCGDTDRFDDGPDSVCSTCGFTRFARHSMRYDQPRPAPTALPPSLFDAANLPEPATITPQGSIEANFLAFHEANPWVYDALVKLARDLRRDTGFRRNPKPVGIGMLWEVLRWQWTRNTTDTSEFKLNNNYRSRYARLIMEQEADLDGVFQVRELSTP